ILSLYLSACINFINDNKNNFKENAIVVDCCGVKTKICSVIPELAVKHRFKFLGGHPMAGTEKSGYEASFSGLFNNSTMLLCPNNTINNFDLEFFEYFFKKIGFKQTIITTHEKHDEIIAHTSQLAHIISSAYIKSSHNNLDFSAGSFKDMTRVSRMNEKLWNEAFLENRDNLCKDIQSLIDNLNDYKNALQNNDKNTLSFLIEAGNIEKNKFDDRSKD
ncbi:prephenate dehydrogenase/arogenate dehydrogenase family protein, partial [Eubacteriales bacterium OttesenSCG-928-G02]|nr:prephenate dehydrogenase/arogenate dehydrogenase family protein [Eubacteriales bacterium OttesenSCG-928-G02]